MNYIDTIDLYDLDHCRNDWQNIQVVLRKAIKSLVLSNKAQKEDFENRISKLEESNAEKDALISKICSHFNSLDKKLNNTTKTINTKITSLNDDIQQKFKSYSEEINKTVDKNMKSIYSHYDDRNLESSSKMQSLIEELETVHSSITKQNEQIYVDINNINNKINNEIDPILNDISSIKEQIDLIMNKCEENNKNMTKIVKKDIYCYVDKSISKYKENNEKNISASINQLTLSTTTQFSEIKKYIQQFTLQINDNFIKESQKYQNLKNKVDDIKKRFVIVETNVTQITKIEKEIVSLKMSIDNLKTNEILIKNIKKYNYEDENNQNRQNNNNCFADKTEIENIKNDIKKLANTIEEVKEDITNFPFIKKQYKDDLIIFKQEIGNMKQKFENPEENEVIKQLEKMISVNTTNILNDYETYCNHIYEKLNQYILDCNTNINSIMSRLDKIDQLRSNKSIPTILINTREEEEESPIPTTINPPRRSKKTNESVQTMINSLRAIASKLNRSMPKDSKTIFELQNKIDDLNQSLRS